MINQYEVLGAHAGMDDAEIRQLYRQLARLRHPDRGGDPTRFAAVTAAYAATGTATARAKLARAYALRAPACARCGGCGYTQRTGRGFARAACAACGGCGGCGYALPAAGA